MFAVIQTGGKQYKVAPETELKVEKLEANVGDVVEFEALLVENDGNVTVGSPVVNGVKVKAEVLEHGKAEKIVVFKYISKKRRRSKNGHRQPYTKIKITQIG
ncbi:MAG: 50S ribosomal protein L21 [Christensenellales bacterium]|jgi:large subunit ribosomal protein L21